MWQESNPRKASSRLCHLTLLAQIEPELHLAALQQSYQAPSLPPPGQKSCPCLLTLSRPSSVPPPSPPLSTRNHE